MMKLRNALVLAGLVSLFAAPVAMAGVGFSVVGVGSLGMPSSSGTLLPFTGLSGGFGYGGGALVDLPMGPRLSLELGGIYHTGSITVNATVLGGSAGSTVTASYNLLEVPVTLKIMLSHMIFLNVGGYATSFIGGPTGTTTQANSTVSFAGWGDLGQNTLNYGLIGGVGLDIPVGSSVALRAEALYELQLNNSDNATFTAADSTAAFKYNAVEFRVGLSFGGGMSNSR